MVLLALVVRHSKITELSHPGGNRKTMRKRLERKVKASMDSSMRYVVRITDPATNRRCEVYFCSDRDLECLLLFLGSEKRLNFEIKDLRKQTLDP
jgi:hypothetical protein